MNVFQKAVLFLKSSAARAAAKKLAVILITKYGVDGPALDKVEKLILKELAAIHVNLPAAYLDALIKEAIAKAVEALEKP